MSEPQAFTRKAFLKQRRPERFSDTVKISSPLIDRAQLEYHLDVLTTKKQEASFEEFARALAQKEICPNLIPQTGPTGGGDSRVDSETFPVADSLAMSWYVGRGREAAEERWAFAFSAKKKWQPKFKSDIRKIVETGREYKKAFFVTNQYVPDRKRAELEDALSQEHGLDVRVLDRTWILDRVFTNRRENLVEKHLGIGAVREEGQPGPRDMVRRRELEAAERRLEDASEAGEYSYIIIETAMETIELSRGLEMPQDEIRGRIERAIRIADAHGSRNQQVRARYESAWTAFWWLDDVRVLNRLYPEIETRVKGTRNAQELEYLVNLWLLLFSCVEGEGLSRDEALLGERRSRILEQLDKLGDDRTRPSAALWAKSLSLELHLLSSVQNQAAKQGIVDQYSTLIDRSAGLMGFPVRPLIDLLLELSPVLEETPGFDELFAKLEEIAATRNGELQAASLQIARGARQLDADRPVKAIASLGRALSRLAKHESRQELVGALYLMGTAYHRSGLLWAARGSMVTAASTATAEYWIYGEINNAQLACYDRLRLIELELGRLPQALEWHRACLTWSEVLAKGDGLPTDMEHRHVLFDACLGILLLKLGIQELEELERVPDMLDSLGLFNSAVALRWALGDSDLPGDFLAAAGENLEGYFEEWLSQPASERLQKPLDLGSSELVQLESRVLGCDVQVTTKNSAPFRELAESFLGALEAILSTGMLHEIMAFEPGLVVRVCECDTGAAQPFEARMEDYLGKPVLTLSTKEFVGGGEARAGHEIISDLLLRALASAMSRILVGERLDERLKAVFGREEAISRALNFTSSIVTVANVLGDEPRFTLEAWQEPTAKRYRVARQQPWRVFSKVDESEGGLAEPRPGTGGIPPELRDHSRLSHQEIRILSLIRANLWNRAKWIGTAFLYTLEGNDPPFLGLLFRDGQAAIEIFEGVREDLRQVHGKANLRISIIKGIDRAHPAHYRVSIGSDPGQLLSGSPKKTVSGNRLVSVVVRFCKMEPDDSRNLDGFLRAYQRAQRFVLVPAIRLHGNDQPSVGFELGVELTSLTVRDAWEIGRHDIDSAAILADDDPFVPKGWAGDPPVLEVLRLKREKVTGQGSEG